MASPFSGPPKLLGVRLDTVHTTQEHELGAIITTPEGGRYQYVRAGEAIAAGEPVDWTAAFVASVTDAGDVALGVGHVALALNEYGWVQVGGYRASAAAAGTVVIGPLGAVTAAGGLLNNTVAGADGVRGLALAAESGGVAPVFLF